MDCIVHGVTKSLTQLSDFHKDVITYSESNLCFVFTFKFSSIWILWLSILLSFFLYSNSFFLCLSHVSSLFSLSYVWLIALIAFAINLSFPQYFQCKLCLKSSFHKCTGLFPSYFILFCRLLLYNCTALVPVVVY